MNTLEKISKFKKFGSKLGLERMNRLMDLLGNPQEGLNYIHVGGTNGKGSVSTYIYSVLKENGYSVGMFTSPFMDGFRQAIIVDDIPMTEKELDTGYDKIDIAMSKMKDEGFDSLTEFEVITALSLLYYKSKTPDFVILEVGLGGIGDSTNVIGKPLISVITSVSMDHCDVLGNTIAQIAHEKAGIIKEGTPVVTNLKGQAAKVVAREAYEKNAPLIDVNRVTALGVSRRLDGSTFSVKIDGINYPEMTISMLGTYQIENAVCALTVIEYLRKNAMISLDADLTRTGLKKARLEGRFEILSNGPTVIMDGAHNEQGAEGLALSMKEYFPEEKVLIIFSLMKDKDSNSVITQLRKVSEDFIIADVLEGKEVDTDDLKTNVETTGGNILSIIKNKDELLRAIENNKNKYDIILITGSLYLVRATHADVVRLIDNY